MMTLSAFAATFVHSNPTSPAFTEVARIALGAKDSQTVSALREAEAYPGPALIIAYAHCIAHGFQLQLGLEQQKLAVDSGYWPLVRFDPRRAKNGEPALRLDSPAPKIDLAKFTANESRFGALKQIAPDRATALGTEAQEEVRRHYALYHHLAHPAAPASNGHASPPPAAEPKTPPQP